MKDYNRYIEEYEKAQVYFNSRISDREQKAFEYGTLVVRNAIFVSGGALLAIPTIAGLVSEIQVNIASAKEAGFSFAVSLLLAILGSYVIHVNWTLHVAAWEEHWERRQKFLRKQYLEESGRESDITESRTGADPWITLTFWVPHALAIFYLICMGYGFFRLYEAFGIS